MLWRIQFIPAQVQLRDERFKLRELPGSTQNGMRIQFITNFYPPAARGGYELWCQEVAEGLRKRGHQVRILTSNYKWRELEEADPEWVQRDLKQEMEIASLRNSLLFFTSRKARENENLEVLRQQLDAFNPDRILVWGMWNIHRSLAALTEELRPGRVIYYLGDYWPTLPSQFEDYWMAAPRSRAAALPKMILGFFAKRILAREKPQSLRFEHILFPSEFMRTELAQKGVMPQNSRIVYGAVDTSLYRSGEYDRASRDPSLIHLLFVGRLTPEKGVHTVLDAVGKLVDHSGIPAIRLSIVGTGEAKYEAELHDIANRNKIAPFVSFLGAKKIDELPAIYSRADIFLFTSIWSEPFGRVLIEAMASGLAVVGSAVGGSAEILRDNENALLYPPGDSDALARQINVLIKSPDLRMRLAQNGYRQATEKFDIHQMVAGIENYLQSMSV